MFKKTMLTMHEHVNNDEVGMFALSPRCLLCLNKDSKKGIYMRNNNENVLVPNCSQGANVDEKVCLTSRSVKSVILSEDNGHEKEYEQLPAQMFLPNMNLLNILLYQKKLSIQEL